MDPLLRRPSGDGSSARGCYSGAGEPEDNDVEAVQKNRCALYCGFFGLGYERDLLQIPTLLVEGEKSQARHSDNSNVAAGGCDGGKKSEQAP